LQQYTSARISARRLAVNPPLLTEIVIAALLPILPLLLLIPGTYYLSLSGRTAEEIMRPDPIEAEPGTIEATGQ